MKSIENFTVLNTWALLADFLNEHSFTVTATSAEIFVRAFMVSWRFCDTDNESAGYKESKIFRTATNLVSKRAKFNVDFENNWLF